MAKTILLVDDEQDILTTIKKYLSVKNYNIETAKDGIEALSKARNGVPDLIILDVMLPNIDGYRLCRMLKFDPKYKNIPIILLTAKAQPSDKEMGMKVHADAYMTKPFDINELISKVEELL